MQGLKARLWRRTAVKETTAESEVYHRISVVNTKTLNVQYSFSQIKTKKQLNIITELN